MYVIGLEISDIKTVLVHFNNKNVKPGNTEITIDNSIIKSSDSVKFLGIHLDYNLSFKKHVNTVQKKCNKALNIIKYLCGTWWGACPETLIVLYKSYVRSIIDYGLPIYFPSRKDLITRLDKLQDAAIRAALGYRISTPLNILLAESKLISLKDRAEFLYNTFLAKIMSDNNSLTAKTIVKYYNIIKNKPMLHKRLITKIIAKFMNNAHLIDTQKNCNIYNYSYDTLTTVIPFELRFGQNLKKIRDPNTALENFLNERNALALYTDGSKMAEAPSVGCSLYCPEYDLHETFTTEIHASVYTAECIALDKAFEFALNHYDRNVYIFSDSLSALQSLNSSKLNIKTNTYILSSKEKYNSFLSKSKNKTTIKLFWLPAHSGINGNEQADLLAKFATLSELHTHKKIPFTDLTETFKKSAWESNNNKLTEQGLEKGVKYFELYFKKTKTPWYTGFKLSRDFIVTINRCRSDHYNLAYSLARLNIIDNGLCKCSASDENLNHVIWQCPNYDVQRQTLIKSLLKLKIIPPLNIESLLATLNISALKCIFIFFEKCNLKI